MQIVSLEALTRSVGCRSLYSNYMQIRFKLKENTKQV